MNRLIRFYVLAVLALFPLLLVRSGLDTIHFGAKFQRLAEYDQVPTRTNWGYDGQFYAQLALDPSLSRPQFNQVLDLPAYRARRILLPAISYVLGLGQPGLIVWAYAVINVPFYWLLLYALIRLAQHTRRGLAAVALCMLSAGTVASITYALPDLPAAALVFMATGSSGWAVPALLAAAALSKETSLVVLPAILLPTSSGWLQKWAMAILPPAAWFAYVSSQYAGQSAVGTNNFGWPLIEAARHLVQCVQAFQQSGNGVWWLEITTTLSLLVQVAYLLSHWQPGSQVYRLGLLSAGLFCVLGFSVMVGQLGYTRAGLPMTIAFNLLVVQQPRNRFMLWAMAGNFGLVYQSLTGFI